jgi:glycine/D-amino acid oxidase-like deaminating enzyme
MNLKAGFPFSLIRYGLMYAYPKLTTDITCEVAIIGGGISGALTAHYLCEAGLDCVIVDGRSIGLGSTCASTSLLQYELDTPLCRLLPLRGEHDAVRAYTLCREAIHMLGKLARKVGVQEFNYNQSLYIAGYKKDVSWLHEEFALRKKYGFDVRFLDASEIRDRFSFDAPGGILSEEGAYADAYVFTHELLQNSIRSGLRVFDRTYIKKVSHEKRTVVLTSEEGVTITARKLIFATGYEVTEFLRKRIVKLQSTYAIVSENMPDPIPGEKEVMLWNTKKPYLYLRRTKDGRTIIGGRDEDFVNPAKRDKLIHEKSKQLTGDFNKLFPDAVFKPEFSWTGTFGTTRDGLPYIGQYPVRSNTYFALGFGGNGITFSVIAAQIIRDLLTGKKNPDATIFSFDRPSR